MAMPARCKPSLVLLSLSAVILVTTALPITVEKPGEQYLGQWPWSCYTFGELAQNAIPPEYDALIPVLKSTFENPNIKPEDTEDARRRILKIRNYLDVFAPTYPAAAPESKIVETISKTETIEESSGAVEHVTMNETITVSSYEGGKGDKGDLFDAVRSALNEGYEMIGEYKDLAEDHIKDAKVEEELRAKCVAWYKDFMEKNENDDFSAYLQNPDMKGFHKHEHWSKFFWKADPKVWPEEGMSGVAVLELLVKIQLEDILKREKSVFGLKTLLDFDAHEEYHNFRKSVRAIFLENEMFGSLVFDDTATEDLNVLHTVYHKFGQLNDKWNKWWFYHKHGKADADKMGMKVDKDFKELTKELKDWDIPGVITRLNTELIEPCKL